MTTSRTVQQLIAANIIARCRAQNVRPDTLAYQIGISRQSLDNRLLGLVNLSVTDLVRIAEILETTPQALMEGLCSNAA